MNKRVIAVAALVSVLLVGIWYFAVFSTQSHSIHKSRTAAAAARSQAAELRSQIAVLQQEKTQLPAATNKLSTLQLALPNTAALDKLIDNINADAAQTGVDWQSVTPTKPTSYAAGSPQAVSGGFPDGMQSVTVAMQVTGAYKQVLDFVTGLNGMSRLLDVGSVSLNGVGGTGKSTAQITSQIFYVPPAVGSVAPATPVAP